MIEEFYKSIRYAVNDIIIFPNESLKPIFIYAVIISSVSTIFYFTDFIIFLNIVGAWIGTGIIGLAYLISKYNRPKEGEGDEDVK